MSTTVAFPSGVGNSVCDKPTYMDVSRIKLMADSGLLSISTETSISSDEDHNGSYEDEIGIGITAITPSKQGSEGEIPLLNLISRNISTSVVGDEVLNPEIEEEENSMSLEGDPNLDISPRSVASENSSIFGDEFISSEITSDFGIRNSIDAEKSISAVRIIAMAADLDKSNVEADIIMSEPLAVAVSLEEETGVRSAPVPATALHQPPLEKEVCGTVGRSVFELDWTPLWGFTTLCGKRPEMEDAVATVPRFMKIPIEMLIGDRIFDGMNKCFRQQTSHFYGVYDGHGGSQAKFYFVLNVIIVSNC